MDRGFVITDERLHTGLTDVYAVGDIVPGLQLAHRGFAQGIFVAEEIAGLNPAPIVESSIPRVTYCEPEVASVGLTEAQAKEVHGEVETYEYNLGGNGKSPDPAHRRASSSSSGSRTAPSSASTWSAPGSAS